MVKKKNLWNNLFDSQEVIQESCVPAFMKISKNSQYGPVWILGMPFLRYYYSVFDRANKKVYISEATPGCKPAGAYWGAGMFFNTTHGVNGTGLRGMSRFGPEDFEPNEADPNEMRAPAWATEMD